MKKIFAFVLVAFFSLSIMAERTSFRINLIGSDATYSVSTLKLVEDDNHTPAVENGYDATAILSQSNEHTTLIYGFIGTGKYSTVQTNNLEGLEIGFVTNQNDASYKLSFTNYSGTEEFVLYDREAKKSVIINASTPDYPFTATAGQVEINNRFVIGAPATGYTVTPNAAGYATFSAAEATVIPTGATAYTGTISGEELVLNQIMGGYVPANTGVIVAGVAGTPYNFAIYDGSVDAIAGNALQATSTYNTSMKNVYVLKGNAFLEYVGTNALAANKAYIQLPAAGPNNAPKRITMRFNGTTAVDNVETEAVQPVKFIENGEIFIRRGNEVYNLQGQLVK